MTRPRWLNILEDYRRTVVEDRIHQFSGYFDLTRGLSQTASGMYSDGSLFEFLEHEDIAKLQGMYADFTAGMETTLNNRVQGFKNIFGTENYVRANVAFDIDVWEARFKPHKELLDDLIQKLS